MRSRRGFESLWQRGYLADAALPRQALACATLSIAQAYLLPCAPDFQGLPRPTVPLEPVVLSRLRTVAPGSSHHLTLVEVVRRQDKLAQQAADKADKQAIRAAQERSAGIGPTGLA